MKAVSNKIKTYAVNEWRIDIITDLEAEVYEGWLYHRGYGVKHFMYGLLMKDISFNDFKLLVLEEYTEYIDLYVEEVMIDD